MAEVSVLREQFEDLGQQREAAELGIWVFLATEILFFGALFVGYAVYRTTYPAAFNLAGKHTDLLLGTINSFILLTSSLFAGLAARDGEEGYIGRARLFLFLTILLGVSFVCVKLYEYWVDIQNGVWIGSFTLSPPQTQIFFSFYWVMTFIHGIHISIGLGVLASVYWLIGRAEDDPRQTTILKVPVLYWHFVDIVWIFLYPLLYLVGR